MWRHRAPAVAVVARSVGVPSTPGYALVLDPAILQQGPDGPDLRTVLGDVRVAATALGAGAIFVGISPAADVEAYLGGVERGRLIDATAGGRTGVQPLPGGPPVGPPSAQGFWVASEAGAGARQVTWAATEGRWTAVVMNADGSRAVAADMAAGVTAPMLRGLWTALYATAALVLVVGALLVALALPWTAHRAAASR